MIIEKHMFFNGKKYPLKSQLEPENNIPSVPSAGDFPRLSREGDLGHRLGGQSDFGGAPTSSVVKNHDIPWVSRIPQLVELCSDSQGLIASWQTYLVMVVYVVIYGYIMIPKSFGHRISHRISHLIRLNAFSCLFARTSCIRIIVSVLGTADATCSVSISELWLAISQLFFGFKH